MMRDFTDFVCIDWSGQAVAKPKGLALAHCRGGDIAPTLLSPAGGWWRGAIRDWLLQHADAGTNMIVGVDFSLALPFLDRGAYFPEWPESPADARSLWRFVETMCEAELHLAASSFSEHAEAGRHFRRQIGRDTLTGDLFQAGAGRLRRTERNLLASKKGNPASCFNLVGAKQVGKSSLTGMRLLNALDGRLPIWPLDDIPSEGPLLVEIYTAVAAIAAGLSPSRTKVREGETLDLVLAALGSLPHRPLSRYDDHSTDAIVTAAWLRRAARDAALWSPAGLDAVRRTEGWTFGVP